MPADARPIRLALAAMLCAALAGCSVEKIPFVFKQDIEQGNVVDQAMVARLEPGMSREQVRFVLGSPMLVDPFRDNRWDYLYSFSPSGDRREQRNLTLLFDGDELVQVVGDVRRASGPIDVEQPRTEEVDIPAGLPRRDRGLLARWFDEDAVSVAERARTADTPTGESTGDDSIDDSLPSDIVQDPLDEQEAPATTPRRSDEEEEFIEDLLEEL